MIEIKEDDFKKMNTKEKIELIQLILLGVAKVKKEDKNMNKDIKKTVKEILEKDRMARDNDRYLIQQVVLKMLNMNWGTAFGEVLQGMEYAGISFEAITRARRKVQEENPELRAKSEIKEIRSQEEAEYFEEYSNHIPRLD